MPRSIFVAIVLAVGLLVACTGASGGAESTTTATATATATLTATDTPTPEPTPLPVVCTFADAAGRAVAASAQVWSDNGAGTAFHVGDGVFVTAAHVVAGTENVQLLSTTLDTRARVIDIDEDADVATLLADLSLNRDFPTLEWGDSSAIIVGQGVGASGYSPGVEGNAAIARGTVSRLFSLAGYATIQTDTAVNPGNSGGPLFDECGNVVGVVLAKLTDTSIEGIGYAITESSARFALDLPATFVATNPEATASPPPRASTSEASTPEGGAAPRIRPTPRTPRATPVPDRPPATAEATPPPPAATTMPAPTSPPPPVTGPPATLTGVEWEIRDFPALPSPTFQPRIWEFRQTDIRVWDNRTVTPQLFTTTFSTSDWLVAGNRISWTLGGRVNYEVEVAGDGMSFHGTWLHTISGQTSEIYGRRTNPIFALPDDGAIIGPSTGDTARYLLAGSDRSSSQTNPRFELVTAPTQGTVTLVPSICTDIPSLGGTNCYARVEYQLDDPTAGVDTFRYRFVNGNRASPPAVVTIYVGS